MSLVSLRVLDCDGSGWMSDFLYALDWAVEHKPAGPSVINFSDGGDAHPIINDVVAATSAAGIPVVVAAGNEYTSACNVSPASAPEAITVAASDAADRRPGFSNFGSCVDLFAPGVNVRSAWWTSGTAYADLDGTSMATPHVTGVVARYLQANRSASPARVSADLLRTATTGAVVGPSGAPNRLLYAAGTVVKAPGVPTAIKLSKSDKTKTATLQWAATASNGGAAITGYRVTRNGTDSNGRGPVTVDVAAGIKRYTFSSLRAGGSYTVTVRAKNVAGFGPAVSKKVTMMALPGAPRIKAPMSGSTKDKAITIKAAWKAPSSGGPVGSYSVTATRAKTGKIKTATAAASARSIKITGLVKGQRYTVRVKAVNAAGKGAASAKSAAATAR